MQIYIHRNGQQSGPFPIEEIQSQLSAGTLQPGDLAWYEGAAGWLPVSSIPGVAISPPAISAPAIGAPAPRAAAPPMAAASPRPASQQTSGLAIASMVLGLLGFLMGFITGIPAVICGHIALSRIKKAGGALAGKGFAITGLVTGYISVFLVFVVAILAAIALPVFKSVQVKALETKSLSDAKQIALGCRLYATDNDDKFPDSLDQLFPNYLNDHSILIDPMDPTHTMGFQYFGGKDTDPPGQILLESQIVKDHRRVVVHVDGSGMLQQE
jgi:hypothetical protein